MFDFIQALAWPVATIVLAISITVCVWRFTGAKSPPRLQLRLPKGLEFTVAGTEAGGSQEQPIVADPEDASSALPTQPEAGVSVDGQLKDSSSSNLAENSNSQSDSESFLTTKEAGKVISLFEKFKLTPVYEANPELWETHLLRRQRDLGIGGADADYLALAAKNPTWVRPLIVISNRYKDSGDKNNSIKYLDDALSKADSDEKILLVLRAYTSALLKLESAGGAIHFTKNIIKNAKSDAKRAAAALALAECLKDKHPIVSIIFREYSLKRNPPDHPARFDLAYAYGLIEELWSPCLWHYDYLLDNSAYATPSITNNKAAQVSTLNKEALSAQLYSDAMKLGNDLSATNLSDLLVHAGFHQQAAEALESIKSSDRHEEKIAAAKQRLFSLKKKIKEQESEVKSKSLENYSKIHAIMAESLNYYINNDADTLSIITINCSDPKITGTYANNTVAIALELDDNRTLSGTLAWDGLAFSGHASDANARPIDKRWIWLGFTGKSSLKMIAASADFDAQLLFADVVAASAEKVD